MELHASVKQVQRSSGRSSVAAAAYRAAARLVDERTGLIHDYSKKQGVEHTQIFTPANAPDWSQDRAKLWNACEQKENRVNSCTAHELELGFPSEFNADQRREAGDNIARELMKRYDCAVDIAYHSPSKKGDDRNFHAHILFTSRSLDPTTKDGWQKNKFRDLAEDTKSPDKKPYLDRDGNKTTRGKLEVSQLRIFAANEMNRISKRERLGVHVEHLSYKERGIDKQPTQHMGNKATEMERRGEVSRIGEKNRTIEFANAAQVRRTAYRDLLAAQIERTKTRTAAPEKLSFKDRLRLHGQDIASRHDNQRKQLSERQEKQNTKTRNSINAQLRTVSFKLENATGARKLLRGLLGHTKADRATQNQLQKALQAIKVKEQIERVELERKQHLERDNFGGQSPELRQQFSRTTVSSASEQTREEEPNFKDRLRESYRRSTEGKKENKRDREQENGIERKPNEP